MNYFWLNHGITCPLEVAGGFLWAPHLAKNGRIRCYWDSLDLLQPGDIVFNYAKDLRGFGVVQSVASHLPRPYDTKKPYSPFQGGRLVFCEFHPYQFPIGSGIPLSTIQSNPALLNALSLGACAPFTSAGKPAQKYLCPITSSVGNQLMALLVSKGLVPPSAGLTHSITTSVKQLVDARVGQGQFRKDLLAVFGSTCPITGLARASLLRASHIQAWVISNNQQRLDPDNGLLLAPGVDLAFDRGLISFDANGDLLSKLMVQELQTVGIFACTLKSAPSGAWPVGSGVSVTPSHVCLPKKYQTPNRMKHLKVHRNAAGWP